MFRLTFRFKLLLAMMFIVTGVSVATLLVAQRRVQKNYERMFRNQFERQIGYFTASQEARLGNIKEQCLKLCQSVRLIAMMGERELEAKQLYEIAATELRSIRSGGFCLLDADGKVVVRPEGGARPFEIMMRKRLETHLIFARSALGGTIPQQVGYLPLPAETNHVKAARPGLRRMQRPGTESRDEAPALQEVIVTKIVDSVTDRSVGVLLVVFPLQELVPQRKQAEKAAGATNDLELIQSGVLLEDKLYADASVIPDAVGEVVGQKISEHIKATNQKQADLDCEVRDSHYRVFYELLSDSPAFPPAYQVCLYSTDESLREQRDLRWKVLALGAGALLVALVLSLFISHGLTAPIRELVSGTGEIQKGNFQVRLPVHSQDEVGQLTSSFNDMAEGLAQKERYRTVLNMVADERVAKLLLAGEVSLGGELREVTVLFCDIRGFTPLTQNMPAGEVIEMVNEHMTALTRVVHEHNGLLDKFVGDLLMAVFGAPVREGNDTANAARCALRLIQVREQVNQTSRHQIRIGIGIATGTVVAGRMGSVDRLHYTVLGERVNMASRLCSRAGAGEILIDENTRKKLGDAAQVESVGEMELKGFATRVTVLRLVGMKV